MKVTRNATYALTPELVMDILAEEDFQNEKCRLTYALSWDSAIQTERNRVVIQTRRVMPTDPLPDVARGFVGETFSIHETQTWTGPDERGLFVAELRVHVQGAPISVAGARRLTPRDAEGTHDHIDLKISASVPIIGRKIEEAAAPAVAAGVDIETELLAKRAE
jgi:hypothetical protein